MSKKVTPTIKELRLDIARLNDLEKFNRTIGSSFLGYTDNLSTDKRKELLYKLFNDHTDEFAVFVSHSIEKLKNEIERKYGVDCY